MSYFDTSRCQSTAEGCSRCEKFRNGPIQASSRGRTRMGRHASCALACRGAGRHLRSARRCPQSLGTSPEETARCSNRENSRSAGAITSSPPHHRRERTRVSLRGAGRRSPVRRLGPWRSVSASPRRLAEPSPRRACQRPSRWVGRRLDPARAQPRGRPSCVRG
jgi:hypothetical protein